MRVRVDVVVAWDVAMAEHVVALRRSPHAIVVADPGDAVRAHAQLLALALRQPHALAVVRGAFVLDAHAVVVGVARVPRDVVEIHRLVGVVEPDHELRPCGLDALAVGEPRECACGGALDGVDDHTACRGPRTVIGGFAWVPKSIRDCGHLMRLLPGSSPCNTSVLARMCRRLSSTRVMTSMFLISSSLVALLLVRRAVSNLVRLASIVRNSSERSANSSAMYSLSSFSAPSAVYLACSSYRACHSRTSAWYFANVANACLQSLST